MSPDPTDQAMARLRAADPAATAEPLHLSASDVLGRADEETLVDRTPRQSRIRLLFPLVAAAVALLVVGGFLIRNAATDPDAPIAGTPAEHLQVAANCEPSDTEPSDTPPADAVSVSLCDQSFEPGMMLSPPDALVDNIDQLIAAFDELEMSSPDMMCTEELGPAYDLVFTAADGSTTVLRGEIYGCRTVGERVGADIYLAQFTELLLEQRAERGAWREATDGAVCGKTSWIVATPETADGDALLCLPNDDGTHREVTVEGDDLATLRDDLAANTVPAGDAERECSDRVVLVLSTSYGDQLSIDIRCGVGQWLTAAPSGEASGEARGEARGEVLQWQLSPQSQEIIQRLVES